MAEDADDLMQVALRPYLVLDKARKRLDRTTSLRA